MKILDSLNLSKRQIYAKVELVKILNKWDRMKSPAQMIKIDTKFREAYAAEVKIEDLPFCVRRFSVKTSLRSLVHEQQFQKALVPLVFTSELRSLFQNVHDDELNQLQDEMISEVFTEFMLTAVPKRKADATEMAKEFTAHVLEIQHHINVNMKGGLMALVKCCKLKVDPSSVGFEEIEPAINDIQRLKDDDALIQTFVNVSPTSSIYVEATTKALEWRKKTDTLKRLQTEMESWHKFDYASEAWTNSVEDMTERAKSLLQSPDLEIMTAESFEGMLSKYQSEIIRPTFAFVLDAVNTLQRKLDGEISFSNGSGVLTVEAEAMVALEHFQEESRVWLSTYDKLLLLEETLCTRASQVQHQNHKHIRNLIKTTINMLNTAMQLKTFLIDDRLQPTSDQLGQVGREERCMTLVSDTCALLTEHKSLILAEIKFNQFDQVMENWSHGQSCWCQSSPHHSFGFSSKISS